jgi:hypothetical protein
MADLLTTHEPTPLTPDQEQAIEDILAEARDYYRDKGLITAGEWSAYAETLSSRC